MTKTNIAKPKSINQTETPKPTNVEPDITNTESVEDITYDEDDPITEIQNEIPTNRASVMSDDGGIVLYRIVCNTN